MEAKSGRPFSNLKSWNWQTVLLVALAGFYIANLGFILVSSRTQVYSVDALAFWSVGRIADTIDYSKIYNLDALRDMQSHVMVQNGLIAQSEMQKYLPTPVPYLSIFIIPFQILSRFDIHEFSLLWLAINFLALAAYLFFFYKRLSLNIGSQGQKLSLLLLLVFSMQVFDNFQQAQINFILMICIGEFIRNALKQKPFLAGVWLAGLMLKPQLLIFVLPIMLISRYWRVVYGFASAALVIISSSWMLTGSEGMAELISLLTKYSEGMAVNAMELMINWRMIGVNINSLTQSSLGSVLTALGMAATLLAVIYLVAQQPAFGSPPWMVMLLGVFAATLAFTWHSHNHMAVILVPIYWICANGAYLSQKPIYVWSLLPPIVWTMVAVISVIRPSLSEGSCFNLLGFCFVLSRFIANQAVVVSVIAQTRRSIS